MLNKIGYVKSVDFDGFKSALLASEDRFKEFVLSPANGGLYEDCTTAISKANLVSGHDEIYSWSKPFGSSENYADFLDKKFKSIERALNHYIELGGMAEVVCETGRFVVVQYAVRRYVSVLKQFVVVDYAKDYSELSAGEVFNKLSGGDLILLSIQFL